MGRSSKYIPDFPLLAEGYAREGMIDKTIATKLGISVSRFYEYVKKYKEFKDALKRGKKPVDVEVENALLKRAKGYTYEETKVEFAPRIVEGQQTDRGTPQKITRTKKEVVPDTIAQIFWLKNRRPDKWRDRHDFDFKGDMSIKVISAIPRPPKNNERVKKRIVKKAKPEKIIVNKGAEGDTLKCGLKYHSIKEK